ncbi:hypothetical protein [Runella salmonicolor]|uniref:Uncharacterized protein n=1 Tax=Runella salmonicolor TaxID=2950278 RepID=A0ABT1FUH5_9BACT|nr:hypothetical protein [Runella salmonicolor]MCP1384433.1 hypothetical protein [Runella salmonicolor]
MLEITLGRRRLQAPENWEECSPEQVKTFLLIHRAPIEERSRAFWEKLVQTWLGLNDKQWKKLVLSFQQWLTFKEMLTWVFEDELKGQPFDYFDFEGVRYLLPEDEFANTSALEVAVGNMLFTEFAHPTEPDLSALDLLVATFCRPQRDDLYTFFQSADWNGDNREPYNQARANERAKTFAALDIGIKVSFLTYFEKMNRAFLDEFSELFGKSESEPRYQDGMGWMMMLKNTAKQGIFGNFEQTCNQPARTVWAFMLDDVLDQKAIEAEREKQE